MPNNRNIRGKEFKKALLVGGGFGGSTGVVVVTPFVGGARRFAPAAARPRRGIEMARHVRAVERYGFQRQT